MKINVTLQDSDGFEYLLKGCTAYMTLDELALRARWQHNLGNIQFLTRGGDIADESKPLGGNFSKKAFISSADAAGNYAFFTFRTTTMGPRQEVQIEHKRTSIASSSAARSILSDANECTTCGEFTQFECTRCAVGCCESCGIDSNNDQSATLILPTIPKDILRDNAIFKSAHIAILTCPDCRESYDQRLVQARQEMHKRIIAGMILIPLALIALLVFTFPWLFR